MDEVVFCLENTWVWQKIRNLGTIYTFKNNPGNELNPHTNLGISPEDVTLLAFCAASQQHVAALKMKIGFNYSNKHEHVGNTEKITVRTSFRNDKSSVSWQPFVCYFLKNG